MKNQNILIAVVATFVAFLLCLFIPNFVRMATSQRSNMPFYYYSSVIKELCSIDYSDTESAVSDMSGNVYTEAQADSILPLLNYRQLMADGRLPDSLDGHELTPQILNATSVVEFYRPSHMQAPHVGLTAMLESMPTRVGLKQPDDFFRYTNSFEFIDAQTNSLDIAKNELFDKALQKAGYSFPTQWVVGDANTRKAYDEGYFCLDSKGELFQVKLVNGRPFVKNTNIGDIMEVEHFIMHQSRNKRFYGFVFDKQGNTYILESDNQGGYKSVRLDIDPINLKSDSFRVMGNLLYWNVMVTTPEQYKIYALRSDDLSRVAQHDHTIEPSLWKHVSKYLLPVYLSFENSNDEYVHARVRMAGSGAFMVSGVLAISVFLLIYRRYRIRYTIFASMLVLLTGAAGILAMLILPKFNK